MQSAFDLDDMLAVNLLLLLAELRLMEKPFLEDHAEKGIKHSEYEKFITVFLLANGMKKQLYDGLDS